tara:strand:- start:2156 stop:3520 length:1365 start_codon:yes stop_codon:yes gene_type:complete
MSANLLNVNNLDSRNLNVGAYSDGDLCGMFKIPQNYTVQQLEDATTNINQMVSNSLGIHNRNEIFVFINESKIRLMNKVENNNSMPNPTQMMFNANTPINSYGYRGLEGALRTNKRVILIDSQFRPDILSEAEKGPEFNDREFNTDFTLDLSEPLTDVVAISLSTVNIPTSWYAFDHHLGNTKFSKDTALDEDTNIFEINPGNYDISGLTREINRVKPDIYDFSYDEHSHKVTIGVGEGMNWRSFVYYSENGELDSSFSCVGGQQINQNLGWNLGFRRYNDVSGISLVSLPENTRVQAEAAANTYGPRYFLLELTDFNQTQINSGIVSVADRSSKVMAINKRAIQGTNHEKLTKAQLYTQNALTVNNAGDKNIVDNRVYGPTSKDVLGMIPLVGINKLRPEPLVEDFTDINVPRTYSGPVKIDKLRIRLLDDKGNLVNLHDNDWSFTLIVEQLH